MNGLVRFSARVIAAACTLLLVGNTALRAQNAPTSSDGRSASTVASAQAMVGATGLEFLENKGQVVDDKGNKIESVRFTAFSKSAKLFLMPDRIVHQFISVEGPGATHEPGKGVSSKELEQTVTRVERIDLELVGARTNALRPEGLLPGVTNFFTASAGPEGITGVRSFSTVVYENVYPNIDLVLKARGKGMKAEYIVRPGGDPRQIRLRVTGAQGLERTPEGGYRIRTELGTITEDAPYSFVRTADGSEQEVAVRFRIEGKEIAFDVPEYDRSQTLVIDPARDWGTFHGGNQQDIATGVATQRSFNPAFNTTYIYICGYTAGGTFPLLNASQGTYGGGAYDAFIAAYQYAGTRQYSTYFGGTADDRAWGITADASGEVWIVGQSNATAAWSGVFTNTPPADINAFVARFTSGGAPAAARFVGGGNDDYFLAVTYDGTNLTCGGYTASTGLATTGVYQTTYNGLYCGMVARLPATALNAITWLTYYGNNTGTPNTQETYVTSVSARGTSGDVWIGGYTNSPNTGQTIATFGSFNTVVNNNGFGGTSGATNYDGFVALLTSSGGRTAGTYYGAVDNDRVLGVAHDPISDGVIAVGRTNSVNTNNIIATAGSFNTVLNNGTNSTAVDDGFVVRLTVSGTTMNRDWGSYWGSTADDYLTSVAVDDNNVNEAGTNPISVGRGGKIFAAGLSTASSGSFTSYNFDGSFNTNQGGYDAVWSRIRRDVPAVEYSIITGGTGNDAALAIAVDNQRNVHIAGSATAGGGNLAGGSGAAQTTYGGGLSDGFLVKWCNLIVPNQPELSTNSGGSWSSSATVCQTLNATATGFVTTSGSYPNVAPGTTSGSCPSSAVQTLWVRLTNAVQGVHYRLSRTTLGTHYLDISPVSGASVANATTVVATQDGEIRVNVTNLPAPGTYDLRWEAYTQTLGFSCSENGVTGTNALTISAMPGNDAISQTVPGGDANVAAAPGSTFNFFACGGSSNSFTVATGAGVTYNWCVMQNGAVTTAPTVTNATTQTVSITPNTGAGQRDTLYLRVRLTNGAGCAIEYQAALYVLPVVSITNGVANEASVATANPPALCVNSGGTVTAPASYSYQDSGPHSLVNTYGSATNPGSGATGSDVVTAVTQAYAWSPTVPAGQIMSVTFTTPSSANGGTVSGVGIAVFSLMANPQAVTFNLAESYTGGGIHNCSRTATYSVNFYPQPTVAVTPAPAGPICEGTPVTFTVTVTPASVTSGSFSVTLNAASQTGAAITSGSGVSGGTFGGTTYSGNYSTNPFTLTVSPGTVTAAYDALGSISLTVNSLTNGSSPVSCGLASATTSASVTITQNPDPITSYQQARANTANVPTYGIGTPVGNLVPSTTSQTGTSFQACVYDATNGFGQEYTYTIVSPSTTSVPNSNDNYTWTIPGTAGVDYTLVAGGGTQLGSAPPSATIRWLTPGSRTIQITQVNNQAPGTCQTVNTNLSVNANNLPSSPGTINWQQANWCENSTVSFTYTVPAAGTATFPIQVQFYGENVDASGPGAPAYTPTPMTVINQTFSAAQAGTTVGPFSFTAGNITGGTPPTWVDISIAVAIVDNNGCGRWGPAGVGQAFRSVSTRIWDSPVEPQVQDWAGNPGPFGIIPLVCPNKNTNPNALVPATGIVYPDDSPLGNPADETYHYEIANLSSYPAGTTFQWQLVNNSGTPFTVGTDYTITQSSTGGYNNNRAQIRYGKHLDALTQPLRLDISVTFPSGSGGCVLPFGAPFDATADVTVSPEPNPDIIGADANGTQSLSPPGLCSGNTAMYDCQIVGASSYLWSIVPLGANGNSPAWPSAPSFVGPNNTQIVTINWPAFSDVALRWPRIDVVVQDVNGCYEGDTATAYILPVPNATPIMVGPEGPCVFNGENAHIKAFTVAKSTNYVIASVTWSLTNGFGAVYSYTTTGAPFTAPNANDTVRYQFYSAGNETVTATVTTTNGCTATGSLNFTIYPPPSPVISGPTSICYNQSGTYTATPFIAGDTYTWDIIPSNGGSVTSGQGTTVATIAWNGTGGPNTYTVRLTQVSAMGCTARVYYGVVVNPNPTPSISGPSIICANQNYTYTTQNNAPASSYVWTISANTAGATIVSGQNTATVTVSATTAGGSFNLSVTETIIATTCQTTVTKTGISVQASPTPSISRVTPAGPIGQACVGQTITYQTPASGNNFQWSVTSGGSIVGASTNNSVQINWTATGSNTITLVETIPGSSCSQTVSQTVNVVAQPTPVVTGPVSPCATSDFNYTYQTANNTGSTYTWTLGAGVNAVGPTTNASIVVFFSNSTSQSVNRTLQVTETNSANCAVTSSVLNVTVHSTPNPSITGPSTACQNSTQTYTDANAASYTWAAWNWSVTGGTIVGASTGTSVQVQWTGSGSQTVTLQALNPGNASCAKTVNYNVVVNSAPTVYNVGTTTPTACSNVSNNVTITLSGSQTGVTYTVNRSPGGAQGTIAGTGSPLSFTQTVSTAGTYQYTITASDGTCTSTMNGTATVVVTAPPTASVSGTSALCSGSSAVYTATPASGVTYAWSVSGTGNSVQSTTANQATILFGMTSGTATVSVVVTDGNGCTGSASQSVTVHALPLDRPVTISPSAICAAGGVGGNVTSSTVTVGSTGNPVQANTTYQLVLSGNVVATTTTGAAPPATVTFTVSGLSAGTYVYSVRAISSTSPACTTVMTQTATLVVNSLPTPAVTGPTTPCTGTTVTYVTQNNTGSTYSWTWSPAADFTASGPTNTYQLVGQWTAAGSKTVTVTETNAQNCGQSNTLAVSVSATPTPTISGTTNPCGGTTHTYTATAGFSSYAWSISPGSAGTITTSSGNTATIQWSSGPVSATVTVVATQGSCSGTGNLAVNVQAAPTVYNVGTTTPTACSNVSNNVTITLSGSQAGVTYTVNRSPGGAQGTIAGTGSPLSFTQTVSTAGTYQYTITATSGTCTNTMNGTATVVVTAPPTASVSGTSALCSGSSAVYTATPASGVTYAWSVSGTGNSVQSTTANQATILFGMTSGTATVSVVVTDGNGCTGSANQSVTVHALPLDRPVAISPSAICAAGGVGGNVTSSTVTVGSAGNPVQANTTYQLVLSGNVVATTTTGAAPPATVTFTVSGLSAGTYVYNVRAISSTSPACTTVMTQTATLVVNPLPTPAVTGNTTPCVGQTVTYATQNNTGSTYAWTWSPVADFTPAGPTNTYQITGTWGASGSKTITVTETNSNNCGQSNTLSVTVSAQIAATVSGASALCSGSSAVYTATPASGVTYAWSVSGTGNSVQSTTANQATILFGMTSGTATVSVVVTDGNGCTGSASQSVTVHALPLDRPVAISPSAICAAGGVGSNVTSTTITVGSGTQPVEANTTYQLLQGITVVATQTTGATPPNTVTFPIGNSSAGTYVFSVRAISSTSPACTTVMTQTATLVVNPLPTPAVTGPTSPCQGTTVTYVTQNNTGSTYSWTTSGASFSASGPTNTYQLNGTWTGTGSGTVTVTETNSAGCGQTNSLNVTVQPAPTPTITASQANPICGGQTVTFTATPSGASSYTWTVGSNGTLQSGQGTSSIVVTWANTPSSYSSSVSVVVNVGGCTGSTTYTVSVNPQATPTISGPATICSGQSGTYSTPLTTGRTYSWSTTVTPPGMTPFSQSGVNLNSVTINWVNTSASPFTATVQVIESAAGVCTGTATYNVVVNPLPSTAITGPTSVCQGQTVTYSHSPALTGHSFAWGVTNAASWSGQGTGAITVTWGNVNGTVSLTVTNTSTGCTNTATNSPITVTVNSNPQPTISGNTNPCAGSTHSYTATPAGASSYAWSIVPASAGTFIGGSTTQTVNIQWINSQTTATLTVVVTNAGCSGTQTVTINVQPKPTPSISGAVQTCPAVDQTYSTPFTSGNTYSWTLPGGTFIITGGSLTSNTVTVRWNSPGASPATRTVSVTETNSYGCQGTASVTVTVNPAPEPLIAGNTNVCGYLASYDNMPINNTQTYTVSDANGISYTTAQLVWTLPSGGGTFTGASSGTGVTSVTVQWDEPTSAATVGRQIAVHVTLGAPTNCTGQSSRNVQVNWNPKPSISGPRAWCDNSPYSANSTVNVPQSGLATYSVSVPVTPPLPSGSSRTYTWTISPASAGTVVGSGSTVQVNWTANLANSPVNAVLSVTETINYMNTGATPTNVFCGVTDTFRVVINPIPKPVITSPNNGITGPNGQGPCGRDTYTYQVTADANSTYLWNVSGGTIVSGQGTNSIQVSWNNVSTPTAGFVGVSQTFQTPATMCSTYVQQNLTIQVKPTPKITGPTVLCQQTTNGTNIGNYTVQTVVPGNTYAWVAEPASLVISTAVSGAQNQNFQVTWGGTSSTPLSARVIVLETNPVTGCLERDTLNVTLNPNPTPVITSTTGGLNPNGVCAGSTHIYQTQFNSGNSYLWTVTGGTISGVATNNQVTVTWGSPGTGTITVREQVGTMFGSGCWTQVTANVTIQPLPNPVITGPTTVCRYTQQSYAVQTPNVNNTYQWTVTNGQIQGSSTNPSVTVLWYDVPTGTIAVTETTPPSQGSCSNTASVNVTINPKPAPVISGPPAPPVCVNSTQTYSTPLVTGNTYLWTVTGGTIGGAATNNTVTVTWTTVGNGTISVKQTNTVGCDTTVSRTIPVNALPSVTITPSGPTTICNGQSVTLLATPGFASYSWNTGETTPNITVTQSGTYQVTVVDQNGCSNNSNSITVTVQNVTPPQIQASGPTTFCQGQSVTLSITGTNIQGYAWSNGATTSSITVTTSGSYWCEVTYNNGCKARTEIIQVTVVPRPTVSITANGPTSFCEGGSVVLDAGAGFATYAWSNGTQTVGTNRTLTVTQAGNYTVTVTNNIGCSATSQPVQVTVYPKPAPQIQASGPIEFCEGGSVTLDGGAGFASYQWSNGATTRTITVTQQGSYTVTVTDQNNCSGTSQPVVVTVYPRPAKPTITQTGGTLTSSSAAQYQWYYNGQPISGATDRSYTLIRGRDQSGYYKVRIRDNNGCENTSDSIYIDITPVEVAGDNTGIQFMPNPTSGELRIVFGNALNIENARVIVRSLVGREMLSLELGAISAGSSKTIDLANLPNGVYMVEVILPSGMRTIGRVTKVD